jgi:hypothetical protein
MDYMIRASWYFSILFSTSNCGSILLLLLLLLFSSQKSLSKNLLNPPHALAILLVAGRMLAAVATVFSKKNS